MLGRAGSGELQGCGNVGAWAAEIFSEMGGKVLAVSDAFGAVESAEGLNVPELRRHLGAGGKLADFPGGALGCMREPHLAVLSRQPPCLVGRHGTIT